MIRGCDDDDEGRMMVMMVMVMVMVMMMRNHDRNSCRVWVNQESWEEEQRFYTYRGWLERGSSVV